VCKLEHVMATMSSVFVEAPKLLPLTFNNHDGVVVSY
jgi:hypothetical protein